VGTAGAEKMGERLTITELTKTGAREYFVNVPVRPYEKPFLIELDR
jgi:hypothetical protein